MKIQFFLLLLKPNWIPWMLTKISTSVYLDFIFDVKQHWKKQKRGFFMFFLKSDDGDLFTLRDVLAAFEMEVEISPSSSYADIAYMIVPKIVAKWKKNNLELVLIAEVHQKQGCQILQHS